MAMSRGTTVAVRLDTVIGMNTGQLLGGLVGRVVGVTPTTTNTTRRGWKNDATAVRLGDAGRCTLLPRRENLWSPSAPIRPNALIPSLVIGIIIPSRELARSAWGNFKLGWRMIHGHVRSWSCMQCDGSSNGLRGKRKQKLPLPLL